MEEIGSFLQELDNNPVAPNVYSKTTLSNDTISKLLSYQVQHVVKLINILLKFHVALDSSDVGIGKTYAALAVAKELGKRPIITCPKTLIHNWRIICEYMGVKPYDIVNIETLKNGKTYKNHLCKSRKKAPYLELLDEAPDNLSTRFLWKLPKDAMIIIDEVHKYKHPDSDNGQFIMSIIQCIEKKIPALILSATICENFADMKIPFYLFGMIPHIRNYGHYIKTLKINNPQYNVSKKIYPNVEAYNKAVEKSQIMIIYKQIKGYCSRIKVEELGDKFPSNQICTQQFIAEESDKISEAYEKISVLMKELKQFSPQNQLAMIQKLKQEIEFRKIPIFIEQAQLYLNEGKSVLIFVNYLNTLHFLADELNIKCKIYGDQTIDERQKAIDLFQSNLEKIIILQVLAGGVGLSLHDIHGDHPRVTLINYPDTGSALVQALGRAARSGAKTPVLQRIIFVANVEYEKKIMENINRKLRNISLINDGDLNGHQYEIKN